MHIETLSQVSGDANDADRRLISSATIVCVHDSPCLLAICSRMVVGADMQYHTTTEVVWNIVSTRQDQS